MKKDDYINRFLPPVCETVDDWVTVVCFVIVIISLIGAIVLMIFSNPNTSILVTIFGMAGSFAAGRVSIVIGPRN